MKKIHNYEITLNEAKNNQTELGILINKLNNNYNPKNLKKIKEKNNVLKSGRKLLDVRKDIIHFFKKGLFPYKGNIFKTKEEESKEESESERFKKFIKYIENKSKEINYDLFKDYFNHLVPSALSEKLYETKKKKKKYELVELIKVRWSNLKDEVKKMSEDEKEIEKADKILKLVEEILDFNNKQNQIKEGLKILAPNQMLSRLPISLAQLNVGNNSEKLKNEIRQFNYS